MTEEQRRYSHARRAFKSAHVDKAQELIDAADAVFEAATIKVKQVEETMEQLRPVWAHGWTSDSVAAQSAANALSDLWASLDVKDQTAAVLKLGAWREAMNEFCDRVETGDIRSKLTYTKFCELLDRQPYPGPSA